MDEKARTERKLPSGATLNEDRSITYKLMEPFDGVDGSITEIRIKRPTVKDLKRMDGENGAIGKTLSLLTALTGIAEALIENGMDGADFMVLDGILSDFLGVGRPTGSI